MHLLQFTTISTTELISLSFFTSSLQTQIIFVQNKYNILILNFLLDFKNKQNIYSQPLIIMKSGIN